MRAALYTACSDEKIYLSYKRMENIFFTAAFIHSLHIISRK